jgi:hypothetical protein
VEEINKHLTNEGYEQNPVKGMQTSNHSFLANMTSEQAFVNQEKMPFSAFSRKVLYVYSIDDSNHIGMVKVGDTTIKLDKLNDKSQDFERLAKEAAHKRIKKDIGGAHGVEIKYNLEFATIVWNDPYGNFRDYTIHDLLEYNGFERVKFSYTKAREWFKANVSDIIDALNAYNSGFKSIDSSKVKRYIELREEQVATRTNTLEARHLGEKERLWDCKPRFGKTTTGISVLLESHANPKYKPIHSALIATNRPDVLDSWFKEYETMMGDTDWQFSSKKHGVAFDKIDNSKPYIVFMSLQDLKGKDKDSVTSFKKSNQVIYSHDWDFLFIDEAHEGNDTQLADEVHEGLKRGFTLYLSGTPFKYLASGKFKPEQIDTWDYIQEQTAKQNWDYSKGDNPYKLQPQLWINAIDLSPETKELFSKGVDASAFDFSEFFKLDSSEKFVNEKYIKSLLKRMQGDGEPKVDDIEPVLDTPSEPHMPYSESFRETTKHTLWVLPPNVKACRALGKLLEEDSFFKDYTVIVAAGSDTAESKNALKSVQHAIKNSDKTITLTVGKLTTGVTVPEWTGVMMLTNMSSAALYTQTIFRTQSPYEFDGKIKENVYTWDFAPDRVLSVMSEVAGISSKAGVINSESQRAKLGEMLNFMPIIAYTSAGDFRQLSAGEISLKLKAFYAERAINSGFETPVLFRKDLENVPENIRKAIQELYLASGSSTRAKEPKWEVIISSTGDAPEYEYLEPTESREPKELTAEQEELRKKRLELLKERENMRNILYAASSRIPFILLAKMCDEEFRKNLNLGNEFGFKELAESFDDESWKEFFQTISKELFISLEEAFDMDTTRGAILQWIANVQEALNHMGKDSKLYAEHVYRFMKKIKNPNKETVFTPAEVVKLVYEAAGFKDLPDWKPLYLNGEEAAKAQVDPFPTFYDINVKSGLFPMEAANNLFQVSSGRSWKQVCNESIYANARTVAGKMATCSLLGMKSDWKNITVIDVYKELQSADLQHLTDEGKQLFVSHFLLSPLNNKGNPNAALSDITKKEERVAIINIVEAYEKENKELNKKFEREEMTEESYKKSKKDLESRVKKELNTSKQFDHVISNPPYQINLTETTSKAKPIWQHFLILASQIGKHVAMINPARWQKGGAGAGLLGVKEWLMENKNFHKVINMPSAEIFPTASIAGEVSIEVIDNTKTFANPKIGAWDKANGWSELKDFILTDEIDIPLSEKDSDIVTKIQQSNKGSSVEKELWIGGKENHTKKISSVTSGYKQDDYGLAGHRMHRDTDYFMEESQKQPHIEYVKIYYNEKAKTISSKFLPISEFQDSPMNTLRIPQWKSLLPKTNAHFIYRNMGPIGEPKSLSTNTWLCRGFNSKIEVEGFNSYVETYFYRYLISVRRVSQNAYANVHRFVPDLKDVKNPRTGKVGYKSDWIDDDLVILFDGILTVDDWKHIKAAALAADKGKGDYESGWTFPDGTKLHSLTLPSEGVEVMPVLSKPYAVKYLEEKAKESTRAIASSTEPSEDA